MVSTKHSLEKNNIVYSYHHSFAGGSKNTSHMLHYLSQNGCNVDNYFFEKHKYFTYAENPVRTHTLGSTKIYSKVVDFSIIKDYFVADKVIQGLNRTPNPILFGSNLFPYCNILLNAKIQVKQFHKSKSKLIVHTVGSDIWLIGAQLKSKVKWLLENPFVDSIVTYYDNIISENNEYSNIERDIRVLPSILEK